MTAAVEHECIDCRKEAEGLTTRPRKIVTPDGEPKRCTTHLRRFKTRQRQKARGRAVERTYDISAKDAGDLLVFQEGRCWICRTATGASKLLAVEHDHTDDWVRGRLCSTCNQFIGRQLHDDPNAAQRLVRYLSGDTPYRRMLAVRLVEASYGFRLTADALYVVVSDDPEQTTAIWWRRPDVGKWTVGYVPLKVLEAQATPKS